MRTIYVTNGRKDYVRTTLVDTYRDPDTGLANDLSSSALRVGLSTDPKVEPTVWYAPSTSDFPEIGTAVLSLLITSAIAPPAEYWVWADVVDNPTSQPVRGSNDKLRTL